MAEASFLKYGTVKICGLNSFNSNPEVLIDRMFSQPSSGSAWLYCQLFFFFVVFFLLLPQRRQSTCDKLSADWRPGYDYGFASQQLGRGEELRRLRSDGGRAVIGRPIGCHPTWLIIVSPHNVSMCLSGCACVRSGRVHIIQLEI